MYKIIDGKLTAGLIKNEIALKVAERAKSGKKIPHLAAILVGSNASSETYVANKIKDCGEVGFRSTLVRMNDDVPEEELLEAIRKLNNDPDIDAFIVQLPLPEHISENRIIEAIDPEKDADGFHPVNIGRMVVGLEGYLPATPFGIVELLKRYDIETSGRECVVIGRSNIVGRPLSILLSRKGTDATVTLVHSRTRDIASHLRRADIIVAALGSPGFVTADMIKQGAVVIDVGTTRVPSPSARSGWKLAVMLILIMWPRCAPGSLLFRRSGTDDKVALLRNTLMAVELK